MIILIIAVILFFIYIFPIFQLTPNPPYFSAVPLNLNQVTLVDNIVKEKYRTEIYPQGKEIISQDLQNISKISDPNSKLDEIFRWQMRDWHNPNWEIGFWYYFNQSPFFLTYERNASKLMATPSYGITLFAPRNPDGIFYDSDPYWIAYHKVGACESLSTLFSFMAQHSGIESRTVQSINHQWVEVKMNGTWMYYDPWCAVEHDYYNATDGNLTFKTKWYNRTENFRQNCLWYAYLNYNNAIFPNPLFY